MFEHTFESLLSGVEVLAQFEGELLPTEVVFRPRTPEYPPHELPVKREGDGVDSGVSGPNSVISGQLPLRVAPSFTIECDTRHPRKGYCRDRDEDRRDHVDAGQSAARAGALRLCFQRCAEGQEAAPVRELPS